jgi:hypothetical protein
MELFIGMIVYKVHQGACIIISKFSVNFLKIVIFRCSIHFDYLISLAS